MIADHLPPRPTSPPTQRYQTIPSAIVASRYHRGRGANDTNDRVVAQVQGTGPVLPILGGGALCMPFCFWATQTAVAAADLLAGAGQSQFTPYLSPHKAATAIQHAYRSYLHDWPYRQQVAEIALSLEVYKLERNMALAMRDLEDSDDFVYTVSNTAGSGAGFVRWPHVIWTPHWAVTLATHTTTAIADPRQFQTCGNCLLGYLNNSTGSK
jgi:hypothetical protein